MNEPTKHRHFSDIVKISKMSVNSLLQERRSLKKKQKSLYALWQHDLKLI